MFAWYFRFREDGLIFEVKRVAGQYIKFSIPIGIPIYKDNIIYFIIACLASGIPNQHGSNNVNLGLNCTWNCHICLLVILFFFFKIPNRKTTKGQIKKKDYCGMNILFMKLYFIVYNKQFQTPLREFPTVCKQSRQFSDPFRIINLFKAKTTATLTRIDCYWFILKFLSAVPWKSSHETVYVTAPEDLMEVTRDVPTGPHERGSIKSPGIKTDVNRNYGVTKTSIN